MSGRRIPSRMDSPSIGSTEGFDVCCDPCKFLSKTVEAKKFCLNCQENLCIHCECYHKSTKASRHHRLLDQPRNVTAVPPETATSDDSKIYTEYCNIHKKEAIKFFCSRHDKVGCCDCMTLDHRTCNIDYIPDVCSGISKGKEFIETLQNVTKTLKEVKLIGEKAQLKKTENKTSLVGVIKEIEKFQKEMNDRIEHLKQQLVTEVNSYKSHQDPEVDKISDLCARVYSELKQVHTALTGCQTKQLDAQAFVAMKQAQWILNSTHIQAFDQDLTDVLTTISFEPNSQLKNILSQQYGLGKIVLQLTNVVKEDMPNVGTGKSTDAGVTVTQDGITVLHCINLKKTINVRTESDETFCWITGCAVISADRLLLVDCNNQKLKIVNTDTDSVVEEMTVNPYPIDVTVLPQDQVAVTLPENGKILVIGTTKKLKKIRKINVGRRGSGIAYHQDYLYVVCQEPNSLLVLDVRGNIQRDISLQAAKDQRFSRPFYIAFGKDGQTLYISDWESGFVASLSLQGRVTDIYKHNKLCGPRGLIVMEDGSLLVCSPIPGTIHQISADLKQGRIQVRDAPNAQSICCHSGNRQIYVSAWNNDCRFFDYE